MTSSFRWLTLPPNVELGLSDAIIPTQSKHYQITSTARRRNSNVMTAGAQKSSHDRVGSSWVGFYIGLQNPHGLAMTGVFATQRSTAITARYMDTTGWGLVPRLYRSVQVWGNGTEPGMPGPCLILRTWMEHEKEKKEEKEEEEEEEEEDEDEDDEVDEEEKGEATTIRIAGISTFSRVGKLP
ncbi:hypothetical protein V1477_002135 [Vespula maculifrons]|uniref:Uncharacterized protein n=1 Tax=Vespula maculifrons TaxID=7453 RepID=A0ABD2CZB8_VESMC